jgi:glutamate-ammonia-ligase adenylyltransferase
MTRPPRDLLLAPRLDGEDVVGILRPFGFVDPVRADRELQGLAVDPQARASLAAVLADLLGGLSRAADPDAALGRFERLVRAAGNPSLLFSHLTASPFTLEVLQTVLGASSFLSEVLIRNPGWLYWVSDPTVLDAPRRSQDVRRDLDAIQSAVRSAERRREMLRIARRRELLQIGVRDLMKIATVEETVASLSNVAEALIDAALDSEEEALRTELSLPSRPEGSSPGFTVLGLGKLGGGELNFSSDVDLAFLYASHRGRMGSARAAPERSTFYEMLARRLTAALAETTNEGYVYRVDLRLRPEGGAGAIALPLDAFVRYYRTRGRTWERLALLKAWPVGGDRDLGSRFRARVRPFIYGARLSAEALDEVRGMKAQIDRKVALRGETDRHVKLGLGGIREIELVVQAFQVRHGARRPGLRQRGTIAALGALREAGLLPAAEHTSLVRAYLFLRDVENKLQMAADAQVHVLPEAPRELRACALRLGYRDEPEGRAVSDLLSDYRSWTSTVRSIFEDVMRGERFGSATSSS